MTWNLTITQKTSQSIKEEVTLPSTCCAWSLGIINYALLPLYTHTNPFELRSNFFWLLILNFLLISSAVFLHDRPLPTILGRGRLYKNCRCVFEFHFPNVNSIGTADNAKKSTNANWSQGLADYWSLCSACVADSRQSDCCRLIQWVRNPHFAHFSTVSISIDFSKFVS